MDSKNSASTLVKELLIIFNNATSIIEKYSDAITSNSENIVVQISDADGNLKNIYIPSFGFLKNEIQRLDNNITSLTGINDNSTSLVRLKDGTYSKIVLNTLQNEASDILDISTPNDFNVKSNWFFDKFINPLLYVTYDLTGKIRNDAKLVLVKRFILNLDSPEKLSYYNLNYNRRSDIDYDQFLIDLSNKNISYFLDEDTVDLPVKENRFWGNFSVIRIYDDVTVQSLNEVSYDKRQIRYRLDKLSYSDRTSNFLDTITLKVGDNLVVNNNFKNTRYSITNIDTSTNIVTLDLIEGYDTISIGKEVLSFYSNNNLYNPVEISIGYNERQVIFIKGVSSTSNIASLNWSSGSAFYSNELTINSEGVIQNLDTYYKNEVIDFGVFLMGLAKEQTPPAILGIKPIPPKLDVTNFSVQEINQHLTKQTLSEKVKKLYSEKLNVQSEITNLDNVIKQKRIQISSSNYKSDVERQTDISNLKNLESQKESKVNLYNTIVNNIITFGNTIKNVKPKWRIRGFWPLPNAIPSARTSDQEVIGFIVSYRYLSTAGDSNPIAQLNYLDNDGSLKSGSFSNWIEYKTDTRKRIFNEVTNKYEWQIEDVANGDTTNINQLDISINSGEAIELRIKSISEAGFPTNPLTSDFSDIIRVDFPTDISEDEDLDNILTLAQNEDVTIKLNESLKSIGVNVHLSSSFYANQKYYAHNAIDIASGELSPEQNPISLFDKLTNLTTKLNSLEAFIKNGKGKISIKLVDEDNNEFTINKNSETKIFAGYYSELVKGLTVKKGAIINKTYYLIIENLEAGSLELSTLTPGSNKSIVTNLTHVLGTSDFDNFRKYDKVPINIQNNDSSFYSKTTDPIYLNGDVNKSGVQSSQVNSQFLYLRYKNVKLTDDLYTSNAVLTTNSDTSITIATNNFVVNNTLYPNTVNGLSDDGLNVHIDYPNLNQTIINDLTMIKSATLSDSDSDGLKQQSYTNPGIKIGFTDNDQYLLGKNSVGSFLFLSPKDHGDISNNGVTILDTTKIITGRESAIKIPIIFQFRMTDYFGTGNSGLGNIAGDYSGAITNLSYSKKIGIDLITADREIFSFDLLFNAKYKADGITIANVPTQSFQNAISDLNNTIKQLTPNITS